MSQRSSNENKTAAGDEDEGNMILAVFPTTDGNFKYVVDREEYVTLLRQVDRPPVRAG